MAVHEVSVNTPDDLAERARHIKRIRYGVGNSKWPLKMGISIGMACLRDQPALASRLDLIKNLAVPLIEFSITRH